MDSVFRTLENKSNSPIVMGVLNVSPDSFYDGGKYRGETEIRNRIIQLINEGADLIDFGAFSTRPGAIDVPIEFEISQLQMALRILKDISTEIIFSIDSYRSEVIQALLEEFGPFWINDISGGLFDSRLPLLAAKNNLPYILMHIQGRPETMQINPQYENVVEELLHFFTKKILEYESQGLKQLIIDPGFGFGKNLNHNYQLMAELERFHILNKPILVGISRKSMIQKILNTTADRALNGTTALNMLALIKGAKILRVHDVREARETIEIFRAVDQFVSH